jgi:hypothetical protein
VSLSHLKDIYLSRAQRDGRARSVCTFPPNFIQFWQKFQAQTFDYFFLPVWLSQLYIEIRVVAGSVENRRNWRCRLKIGCRRDERSRVGKQMNATMLSSLCLGTRRKSYFRGYIYIQFTLQCSITNTNVFFF